MNQALVDKIASAVLYEGYILYPYRPSVKNRLRWTFGGLVPRAYSEVQGETEPWEMQTECLVVGTPRPAQSVGPFLCSSWRGWSVSSLSRRTNGRLRGPFPAQPSNRSGSATRPFTPGRMRSSKRSIWANRA